MVLHASPWWAGVALALVVAIGAGIGDWRRRHRSNLDAIGMIDWRTVEMLALIATAMCATVAVKG